MSGRESLLAITGLAVRYGAIEAVAGASLEVRQGQIVTLLGANGAGKSSILNAAMGLVPAAAGRIRLAGEDVAGWPPERIVRYGMSLCPEGRRVFANLTVAENLAIGAATRRSEAERARDDMFTLFPVLAERSRQLAGTLSGGEQQMLAIARAMMSAPKILLLDEPSLGLAPQIVDAIFELVAGLARRGTTVLLVEQNVDLALEIADYGYVLATGAVALSGPATALRSGQAVQRAYLGAG